MMFKTVAELKVSTLRSELLAAYVDIQYTLLLRSSLRSSLALTSHDYDYPGH